MAGRPVCICSIMARIPSRAFAYACWAPMRAASWRPSIARKRSCRITRSRKGARSSPFLKWGPTPSSTCLLRNLPEHSQHVLAQKLAYTLLGIAAAQHGIRDQSQVANVAHAAGRRGAAIEVAAQCDVIFARQLHGA